MTLKVLDLFSGIGGFSLGLERTGGFETVAFCEIEEFPRKVLRKHWPEVPIYEDVRTLTADQLERDGISIEVICGGFPCQDLSVAGKQAGITAERSGLWSEIARLVGELQPRYVIVENVTNLLSGPSEQRGGWFGRVLGDLAALGYDAEWHCIPASYVGARQLRDRVWIMAYPECYGIQGRAYITEAWQSKSREEQLAGLVQPCAWPTVSSARDCGTGHGIPNGIHRNKSIGNAVVPEIPEMIGHAILQAEANNPHKPTVISDT
ncbi:DNA cytosine methyltransferase [Thalassospira lohafexi]|uniref:Cytosine-specific methyltransferase n=1 Tax=Thalassospira lohafexi TaxID=744227 RepID=A0A2N3L0M9_9PROT|nr:DNA (cytosine-5-)-methyltransferase [Thalassospira lohafexi]PKR56363.1 DNA cytosine methyltransferase [Thalassospira lohafexi]